MSIIIDVLFWIVAAPFILLPALWAVGVVASMFTPGPPVSETARRYRKAYGE